MGLLPVTPRRSMALSAKLMTTLGTRVRARRKLRRRDGGHAQAIAGIATRLEIVRTEKPEPSQGCKPQQMLYGKRNTFRVIIDHTDGNEAKHQSYNNKHLNCARKVTYPHYRSRILNNYFAAIDSDEYIPTRHDPKKSGGKNYGPVLTGYGGCWCRDSNSFSTWPHTSSTLRKCLVSFGNEMVPLMEIGKVINVLGLVTAS